MTLSTCSSTDKRSKMCKAAVIVTAVSAFIGLTWVSSRAVVTGKLSEETRAFQESVHRLHGWPSKCFANSQIEHDSNLNVSAHCASQINSTCAYELGQLDGSLQSSLSLQRCLAASIQSITPECRPEVDVDAFRALFPSTLLDESLVQAAIQECKHEAQDLCDDEVKHFHHDRHDRHHHHRNDDDDDDEDGDRRLNLCQVNDIGMCLLSQGNAVSGTCLAALEVLGIQVPLDYEREQYLNAKNELYAPYYKHKIWKITMWAVFGTSFLVMMVFLARKMYLRRALQAQVRFAGDAASSLDDSAGTHLTKDQHYQVAP